MQNTPKEWSLIEKIRSRVQRQNDHTVVPLGDDAFVFKNFPGYSVLCQDMLVEGTHFSLDYFTPFDLGWKSLAVNLSDMAAMGATPHFAHVSMALPKKLNDSWLDEFYKGMTELADASGTVIAGGDLTGTQDHVVIDVSLHGSCESPLTRKGTRPGDLLLSSGPLGLSFTGLQVLQKKLPAFESARRKHLRPQPRLDLVADLQKKHNKVHALMDCSDGLVNDALILKPQNGGVHLFAENLPLHPDTLQFAQSQNVNATDLALWGGEDFELLMAVSPDDYDFFQGWKMIGQFTAEPGVFLSTVDGLEEIKEFKGWQHFQS